MTEGNFAIASDIVTGTKSRGKTEFSPLVLFLVSFPSNALKHCANPALPLPPPPEEDDASISCRRLREISCHSDEQASEK